MGVFDLGSGAFHSLEKKMTEIGHELGLLQLIIDGHDLLNEQFVGFAEVVEFQMAQKHVVNDTVEVLVSEIFY